MVRRLKAYILFIKIKRNIRARIGVLGIKVFPAGYYIYIGSGRKNLMERIKRHIKMKKKKFWHIDYLLTKRDVSIIDVYLTEKTESNIVNRIQTLKGARPYPVRFGSSDTKNMTHFFHLNNKSSITTLINCIEKW
ncbi:hypothetical protein ES703_48535 [subsurface metagenome]